MLGPRGVIPQSCTAREGQSWTSNPGLCLPHPPHGVGTLDSCRGGGRTGRCWQLAVAGRGEGRIVRMSLGEGGTGRLQNLGMLRMGVLEGVPHSTDPHLTWAHLTCRPQQESKDEKPHRGGGTRAVPKSGEGGE